MDKAFKIINPDWSRLTFTTFEVADATMVDPSSATRVIQGEWVELAADHKVTRCTQGDVIHYPKVDIDGQYDTQTLGAISVVQFGNFEVDTSVYSTIATLGQLVEVDVVSYAPGPNNRGIPTLFSATFGSGLLMGIVTKAAASSRIHIQTLCF